jgi:glutamate synthase domain-containing protein 2
MRKIFLCFCALYLGSCFLGLLFWPPYLWTAVVAGPIILLGAYDYQQKRHAIRRNFPFLGRFRYWFEAIRPEIHQYFVETNSEGRPMNREERSVVYQRAKNVLDTLPFGTQKDVYAGGYEWINHSLMPTHVDPSSLRVLVGGSACSQPYSASIFNVSAMSYGSLSANAVLALNGGAKDGGFAHNTGEGSISPYHLENGGDLIWQIGTGYFGCRTPEGVFCDSMFTENANRPEVKMIEIKLSQGAKPSHGGILPAQKVTPEIAEIRGVPLGVDVLSPPTHSTFSTPIELLEFVARLRELSGGKPVGFKLCVGKRREFLAICKAMKRTGITPDFISVDGGEGGTGAAPLEFSNYIGAPEIEGLIFVHNALQGFSLRDEIRIITMGGVTAGFGIVKRLSLGADIVCSARAMMLAIGCIQALKCNTNTCPTGVATQDPELVAGLVVSDKRKRVGMYHKLTVKCVAEMIGAMGVEHPAELKPWHIMRRVDPTVVKHYGELYEYFRGGELLDDDPPESYARALHAANAETFRHVSDL